MLFGGYGVGGVGPPRWLADTVLLDGWHVSRVALSADPEPRGYHALVSLGGRFFALGGRAALPGAPRKARLVRAAVFALELDPRAQAWVAVRAGGEAPCPRASLRQESILGVEGEGRNRVGKGEGLRAGESRARVCLRWASAPSAATGRHTRRAARTATRIKGPRPVPCTSPNPPEPRT